MGHIHSATLKRQSPIRWAAWGFACLSVPFLLLTPGVLATSWNTYIDALSPNLFATFASMSLAVVVGEIVFRRYRQNSRSVIITEFFMEPVGVIQSAQHQMFVLAGLDKHKIWDDCIMPLLHAEVPDPVIRQDLVTPCASAVRQFFASKSHTSSYGEAIQHTARGVSLFSASLEPHETFILDSLVISAHRLAVSSSLPQSPESDHTMCRMLIEMEAMSLQFLMMFPVASALEAKSLSKLQVQQANLKRRRKDRKVHERVRIKGND